MLIVIAEDDDTYSPGDVHFVDATEAPDVEEEEAQPINLLIVGYREDLAMMLVEVEKWVAKGSKVLLFNEKDIDSRIDDLHNHGISKEGFENLTLFHMEGSSFIKSSLEKIGDKNKFGVDYGT